jgi:hypothetical protein
MSSPKIWTNRIAAVALGLGLAMSTVIVPCWWSIFRHHDPSCSAYKPDFASLYTGAVLMRTDRTALYDLEKQRLIQERIDPSRGGWVLPFFYPPFFAVALAPLSWMSFSAAFATMTALNLALLAVALRMIIANLRLNRQQTNWLALSSFCNYGVHYALLEAQTSFIALMLLVLFVMALRDAPGGKAAIWAGLLAFKAQLAVMPFLLLLAKKKWRELGLTLLVIALLCLIGFAAAGAEGMRGYLELSRRAAAGDDFLHIQPEGMHNLRALAHYFVAPPWRDYIWWSATLAALAYIFFRSRASAVSGRISDTGWISILLAGVLVAPHLHSHDLTLLLLPIAFVLKRAGETVPPLLCLGLVTIGILPLINTMAYPTLPPLAPIALLVFMAWNSRRGPA